MNLCVPAPFPYATPLSVFILPYVSIVSIIYLACAFISVYATHIVPLPLSCNHYFHSTACTYKPLLSLYHSGSPAPLLLFFPGFVVSINIFLWLVHCTPLFPLSFLPCFPSLFCFNCHILCTTCYLPFLFYFYSILLDSLSPVPTFCPFLVSFIIIPPSNPASTMSTLHCLYHFYPSYLYPIPFTACLLLSYHQYSLSHASPFPVPLSFSFVLPVSFFASLSVHRCQPNENKNGQDSKVSGEVPSPPYHSIVLKR